MTQLGRKVLIIGAGPAGLSAAYMLAQKGLKVLVLEASDSVGGMAKSITLWGKRVDIGPHRFFSRDPRINRFWLSAVENNYQIVNRLTRIYYKGKFFSYPLQPFDALLKLGITESFRCIFSFIVRKISPISNEERFDTWVKNRFGNRLFNIFFKSYTEKLWGIKVSDLDATFATQRIKKLSLWEAVKSSFVGKKNSKHRTLIDEFAYPLSGAGQVYENIQSKFELLGGVIKFKTRVLSVKREKDGFLLSLEGGGVEFCTELISTMPITNLVMNLGAPKNVIEAASSLRFRNTIIVYILIEGENPFPDQWIYINSDQLRTGRITNFSNWIDKSPTSNQHIICLEYWCFNDDDIWEFSDASLVTIARSDLLNSGLISKNLILEGHVIRVPKCYPVYDSGYKEKLAQVEEYLTSITGLYPIGRYGSFKYNNQDHSILMGLLASENICGGANHNLWGINSDYEYQESSRITATGLVNE